MIRVHWVRRITVVILTLSILAMPISINFALAAEVELSFGQGVVLLVSETISPATHIVGQKVLLSVQNDVLVDGQVVIAAGTPATAEVTHSVPKGSVGKPAEIGIDALSTTAVDGTIIPLRGSKVIMGENKQTESLIITLLCCVLALLMKGKDAQIIEGSVVKAEVYGNFKIDVPEPTELTQ